MKGFFLALVLGVLGIIQPAAAQSSAQPSVPGYFSSQSCPTGVTNCYTPTLKALAGTQTSTSMATATALTIPTGAVYAIITVAGTNNSSGICAYWRDDGTSPTGSAGQPLAALNGIQYFVTSLPIKLIQATGASCTFTASYYG